YRIAADHEFLYRQCLNGAHFHHSDQLIALYASGGFSWNNQINCFLDWLEIARRYGSPDAAERFFRPIIRSAVRSARPETRDLSSTTSPVMMASAQAALKRVVKRWSVTERAATRAL